MFRTPFITHSFRRDGRKCDEMRSVKCKLGVHPNWDGSALFNQGTTSVLATVSGPKAVCVLYVLILIHYIETIIGYVIISTLFDRFD